MGHYASEMYVDTRSKSDKAKQAKIAKRKKELEKRILQVFKCKKEELYLVHEILNEGWIYKKL